MLRKACRKMLLLKIISWTVLSPPFAMAAQKKVANTATAVIGCLYDEIRVDSSNYFRV
jgi:hypothetical protein